MKICQIGTGFMPVSPEGGTKSGSVEKIIYYLSRSLVDLGAEVHIIDIGNITDKDVHYCNIWTPKIKDSNLLLHAIRGFAYAKLTSFKLLKMLQKEQFDIIHLHNQFSGAWITSIIGQLRRKTQTVFSLQNPVWTMADPTSNRNFVKYFLEYLTMKKASGVICSSESLRNGIIKHLGINPTKTQVIYNGIEVEVFEKILTQARPLVPLCGSPTVVCIARIARVKNQMALIEAAPLILEENPSVKLVFVGPITDPFYFQKLKDSAQHLGVSDNMIFTGEVTREDLFRHLVHSDVFVLPSLMEGFPIALLEAMACRKAIVASSIGPHCEVLRKTSELGLTVDPTDAVEIAKAVNYFLSDDVARKRFGENAGKFAKSNFSWRIIAQKTLNYYERLQKKG